MGRTANAGLAAVWKGRVTEQRRSGLSIAEFCRRLGCSAPSFYVWRKRLRAERAGAGGAGVRPAAAERSRPADTALFVPITLAGTPTSGVRLELPSGAVLTLPGDASAELVTTAIQAALGAVTAERCALVPERSSC